ncbi:hypothetical protein L873DRAFT_1804070 [Choiromyces venosus 120613-1]|uniref:Uncharacterized protein n=1 Tax=Choiromyces venosus 120613-1 TaxID=1336337 RepID=A0A3N4JVF4_9PEZI|nr:hypothetical protein L873DRAFT_1804070 [Choiromyces venosus 120613-1]
MFQNFMGINWALREMGSALKYSPMASESSPKVKAGPVLPSNSLLKRQAQFGLYAESRQHQISKIYNVLIVNCVLVIYLAMHDTKTEKQEHDTNLLLL